jgi:hypothetical protein
MRQTRQACLWWWYDQYGRRRRGGTAVLSTSIVKMNNISLLGFMYKKSYGRSTRYLAAMWLQA